MCLFNFMGNQIDLSHRTYVMGILNLTPDSFFDGKKYMDTKKAIEMAKKIESDGADFLDIGAQSTRPGFTAVSPQKEWQRLEPILRVIKEKVSIPISLDTFYPEVAAKAVTYKIDIINDVTGAQNPKMIKVIKESNCGIILLHGQNNLNINDFFKRKLLELKKHGVDPKRICFDPGIGFNKTRGQDAFILNNIPSIKHPDCALLVGTSRKRITGVNCNNSKPCERLVGTIAANTLAINGGANIIRVHDIEEAVKTARVTDYIKNYGK